MDRATNAHKHHVTKALVGRIVRSVKKDASSLRKRHDRERAGETLVGYIRALFIDWNEHTLGMLTAGRMKRELMAQHGLNVSLTKIRHLLKKRLGLSYLKAKVLSPQTNSIRSLACRQAYAMRMLGTKLAGSRIFNVDESWMVTMTYRYRSWSARGRPNSHAIK